jgi:hypothetical protein
VADTVKLTANAAAMEVVTTITITELPAVVSAPDGFGTNLWGVPKGVEYKQLEPPNGNVIRVTDAPNGPLVIKFTGKKGKKSVTGTITLNVNVS